MRRGTARANGGTTNVAEDRFERMPPTARRKKSPVVRDDQDASDSVAASVDAFRRILRELRLAARKTELATGLSAAQMFVLSTVIASPGCSVNDIAAATMTDRSSAAAIVDRLVEEGLVTREQSGEDKRRAVVTATARGKRAKTKAAPAPTMLLLAGLRSLSASELRTLADGLVALTKAMGIADTPPGMLFEEGTRAVAMRSSRRAATK
jgi:DNA-binding MarR family transcriptional regulator